MARDFYAVLGVSRTADDATIKKAYRAIAFEYHPDRQKDKPLEEQAAALARFKEASEAYQVLSDPALRARHDHGDENVLLGASAARAVARRRVERTVLDQLRHVPEPASETRRDDAS